MRLGIFAALTAVCAVACGSSNGAGLGGGVGGTGGTGGSSDGGCTTSLDCDVGELCEPTNRRCVQCISAADCQGTDTCLGNQCRPLVGCESDNACTPMGQLCDKQLGICVDCLDSSQCSGGKFCATGGCIDPICAQGAMRCEGSTIEGCSVDGSAWEPIEVCASGKTCQQAGSVASCAAWSCAPDSTFCLEDEARKCAADGSSSTLLEDCKAAGHYCENGACSQTACKPNKAYCDGKDVLRCDEAGAGTWLVQTCSEGEYCHAGNGGCDAQWCVPNQLSCSGGVAAMCNEDGSSWDLTNSTPCAAQGRACVYGECKDCTPEVGISELRFIQVFLGKEDYVWVQNISSVCSANLDGLVLSVTTSLSGGHSEFVLPAYNLPPREGVKIFEQGSTAQSGSIRVSGAFAFQAGAAGAALLCHSAPCSASNLLDYVTWFEVPSGVPQGIVQLPSPLYGMQTWQEDSSVYQRQKFKGKPPTFYGSDWQLANVH